MSGRDSIDWEFGNAPKQSITEVLQDPRAPTLELPDISTIDLSGATSLSLTPVPPVNLPPPANINHFEAYLRRYAPLISSFRDRHIADHPDPADAPSIPQHFFNSDFTLADDPQFAALQQSASPETPLADHPDLPALRDSLKTHRATLEHRLTSVLDTHSTRLDTALQNIRTLRQHLLSTALTLRRTRTQTAALAPSVAAPIAATHSLTQLQSNLNELIGAAREISSVLRAPSDVSTLLGAGAYIPAIDTVSAARTALSAPRLAGISAVVPVRRALVGAVEDIDAALRADFRAALIESTGDNDAVDSALRDVVALVHRMGRLALLLRFFVREICDALSVDLANVSSLSPTARYVRAAAEKVLLVLRVVREERDAACEGNREDVGMKRDGENMTVERSTAEDDQADILKETLTEFEHLIVTVVDRLWPNFVVSNGAEGAAGSFVVITSVEDLSEESCFDEFKAAFKFGEELRSLEELVSDLERTFQVVKKKSALRAKITEKQITFISAFHKAHVDTISGAVRSDKWQEISVPPSATKLLTAVVTEKSHSTGPVANGTSVSRKTPEGMIVIGDNSYKSIACGVRYLRSVCAYTLLSEQSAILAPEVARRATELSRLFNSLTWKAILGAEALQWSGLRSITARHLSLASRTISMAAALVQHVNVPLEKALLPSQAGVIAPLMTKCEKDLRDHHAQLLAKILAIMMDRLSAHEEVLRSLPWDKQMEMQRFKVPSAYVVTLAKETMLLHRILWAVLPRKEACDIFTRVWAAYGTHLFDAYGSLDGGRSWVRSRVATDVASLYDKLKTLELAKEFPAAIKPITQLYVRFAKEELEAQEKKSSRRTEKTGNTSKTVDSASRRTEKTGITSETVDSAIRRAEKTGITSETVDSASRRAEKTGNISETVDSATSGSAEKEAGVNAKTEADVSRGSEKDSRSDEKTQPEQLASAMTRTSKTSSMAEKSKAGMNQIVSENGGANADAANVETISTASTSTTVIEKVDTASVSEVIEKVDTAIVSDAISSSPGISLHTDTDRSVQKPVSNLSEDSPVTNVASTAAVSSNHVTKAPNQESPNSGDNPMVTQDAIKGTQPAEVSMSSAQVDSQADTDEMTGNGPSATSAMDVGEAKS